jgi:signal transduction histidine kinase/DNA-binding response OmpR family regulator
MAHLPAADRQVFELTLEPMLLVGGCDQVLAANAAACSLWALDPSELDGRPVAALFHEEDAATLQRALAGAATAATEPVRLRALGAGDLPAPVHCRVTRVAGAGDDAQGGDLRLMALRDLAVLDAMERELEFARESAVTLPRHFAGLLTSISHELRLPLNVVAGAADLISRGALDQEQRRHAEMVRLSVEFMADMVTEILSFSRLEAAEDFRLDALSFVPEQTVDWVLRMLADRATAKGLALERQTDPLAGASLLGRGPWIRRVLMNLVGNAIKFTEHGRIEVVTSSQAVGEDRVRIRFEVRDTGPGFEQDDLSELFVPFRQFARSPEINALGTGLGLSICKRLVEAMGGELTIASVPGEGATASFELELARAGRPAAAPNGKVVAARGAGVADPQAYGKARPVRVLVVEDNVLCRDVLLDMLRYLDCTADAVGSGEDALAALDREAFDVVLVDCNLPDMTGCELIRRVRSPDRADPPGVIVIPGGGLTSCVQAGVFDAVPKPINMSRLAAALGPWLEQEGRPPPEQPLQVLPPDEQGPWDGLKPPRSLVEVFGADLAERFARTRSAAERGELDVITREAHAIRGGSMQLGAVRLVREFGRLSELAHSGDVAGIRQLVDCIADIIPDELARFR